MSKNDTTFRKCCTLFLAIILVAVLSTMAFSLVSQTPLFLTTSDKPNIAILLDSSASMWNIMYHPNFPTNCKNLAWYNQTFQGREEYYFRKDWGGNWDLVRWDGVETFQGNSSHSFTYNGKTIVLPFSSDSHDTQTRYTGAYLNWLFYAATDAEIAAITSTTDITYQKTRIRVAKDAILALITSSYNSSTNSYPYRWGVFTYTTNPYASSPPSLGNCTDVVADIATLKANIEAMQPSGSTPLGNSLLALWNYFKDATDGPITSSCQKNFVIAVTDGYPYVSGAGNDAGIVSASDEDYWQNPDYPGSNQDRSKAHIVCKRMHEEPARSGWADSTIDTFVVGLAFGQDDADDPDLLLNMMASNGGGESFGASNTAELTSSLNATLTTITSRMASASSVAVNTAFLTSDTKLYRTKFNSGTWVGFLEAFQLSPVDGAVSANPLWEAGALLNARNDRVIYTAGKESLQNYKRYDFTAANSATIENLTLTGGVFNNFSPATATDMISYIRGDSTPSGYRQRASKLGDMTYSAPVILGPPNGFQGDNNYKTFKTTWAGRTPLIMVGANDGMLHAFNSATGQEQWAFIPNMLLPKLKLLREDPYDHQNYVSGTPTIVDAFIYAKNSSGVAETSPSWRTVLVCGLREGGKGYFALDVTDPANPVPLWEVTPASPASNGLGFSFGAPLIVKLKDSSQTNEFRWVALLPNGYEGTTSGKAASLLVVDLSDGEIVTEITVDNSTNSSSYNNGLSSPAAVDINADGFTDFVYAGDLRGNLWKFDFRDVNNDKWDVSYRGGSGTPKPARALFTGLTTQPITTAPDIVLRSGHQIVFFGTGKYYDETVDKASTAVQSMYGLYDYNVAVNNPTASIYGRSNLQVQTFSEVTVSGEIYRVSSFTPFVPGSDASSKKGWYIDLSAGGGNPSERIVSDPLAHARRIIFTTFIPSSAACSYGGTSWLMEVNMDTGGIPTKPTFDVNKDNSVTSDDKVNTAPPIGVFLGDGIASTATVLGDEEKEHKYISKTTGEIAKVLEGGATSQFGLRNWRQLR